MGLTQQFKDNNRFFIQKLAEMEWSFVEDTDDLVVSAPLHRDLTQKPTALSKSPTLPVVNFLQQLSHGKNGSQLAVVNNGVLTVDIDTLHEIGFQIRFAPSSENTLAAASQTPAAHNRS